MNAHAPVKFGKKVGMGQAVRRVEDEKFISGQGRYTDDVQAEGALQAYFIRSSYAHAKFTIGDTTDVLASEGVKLCLTAADIEGHGPIKCQTVQKQTDGTMHPTMDIPLLCDGVARHVGDAVAMIVAETVDQAEDAAELLEIDWDMLDVVTDTEGALADDAPLVYEELKSNIAFETEHGNADESDAIFKSASRVSELKLINNRLVCNYMEMQIGRAHV